MRPLIEVDDLHVRFPVPAVPVCRRTARVLGGEGRQLQVMPGETVGIVGESGSGKSTLARALLGLTPISDGHVTFDGADIVTDRRKALAKLRRETAMVFQDPYNALNPRLTIGAMLAEVLAVQESVPKDRIPERIGELLDLVALEREFADRKPLSMSGGQCQRAGIARALAVNPKLIVADECVAALDVTIQAQIVDLFRDLKQRLNLTLLFIAHDLAIVRNLCERVVVMYHGEIVEEGPTDKVFTTPREAYTRALIGAIPDIDPTSRSCRRPWRQSGRRNARTCYGRRLIKKRGTNMIKTSMKLSVATVLATLVFGASIAEAAGVLTIAAAKMAPPSIRSRPPRTSTTGCSPTCSKCL